MRLLFSKAGQVIIALALVVAGVFAAIEYLTGAGRLVFVAPLDSPLQVSIDGRAPFTVGNGLDTWVRAEQGAHTVQIGESEPGKITVPNGFSAQLVPSPGQCFVRFDVFKSHYGVLRGPILVKSRHFGGGPFELDSSCDHFRLNQLPQRVDNGDLVYLVLQVPCNASAAADRELISLAFE